MQLAVIQYVAPYLTSEFALPVLFLVGAALVSRPGPPATAWRIARWTSLLALLLAVGRVFALPAGTIGIPSAIVTLLIAFIGWVLTRFSSTYLDGEPRQHPFARWLLVTLAGSSLVVTTDHLGILAVAWLGTSLALQQLLMFYPERPNAQLAAHKKFLTSRVADACVFGAAIVFARSAGTFDLGELSSLASSGESLGVGMQVGVVLIAIATLLKSAQLPFHGWLMQVMEAPTPVSALLHAGVVNLGGFVLIRCSALLAATPVAQAVLVVGGGVTALVASTVMSTRVSVKVALAWSTCAQMGFMLMQCGLGLYEMALLHLVAHSLYKAHAFLGAGTTVHRASITKLSPPQRPSMGGIARVLAALGIVALVGLVEGSPFGSGDPAELAMAGIVALALTPLLGRPAGTRSRISRDLVTPVAVAMIYFGLHGALHSGLAIAPDRTASPVLAAVAFGLFVVLFCATSWLLRNPQHSLARRMHAHFYGGLFLDEWFTRWTLRIWPFRAPSARTTSASASGGLDR